MRRKPRAWTTLEDQFLRAAATRQIPATLLAGRLGRPVEQVRARRRQLGLAARAARRYGPDDDAALRDAWAAGTEIDALAQRLGRSPDALRVHAAALGLHHPKRRRRWTGGEDVLIRDGYTQGLSCTRIADTLSGRTPAGVAARARKLGLATYGRRWTQADDDRLRRLAPERSVTAIARALGRTPEAIRRRARRLDLADGVPSSPPRSGARWTAADDAVLRLHPGADPAMLALRLGRSDHAVATRLRRLGLHAGRGRSPHHPAAVRGGVTAGERRLIERELDGGGSLLSLARRLDRSPASILELAEAGRRAPGATRRMPSRRW